MQLKEVPCDLEKSQKVPLSKTSMELLAPYIGNSLLSGTAGNSSIKLPFKESDLNVI